MRSNVIGGARRHRVAGPLGFRHEFGNEGHWSFALGKAVMAAGAEALWPTITAG
jgi:hypothetical protein